MITENQKQNSIKIVDDFVFMIGKDSKLGTAINDVLEIATSSTETDEEAVAQQSVQNTIKQPNRYPKRKRQTITSESGKNSEKEFQSKITKALYNKKE